MLKVAVVTPYYREPTTWLRQCHESVRSQTYPCTHIMVADGAPNADAVRWDTVHIALPENHHDYGDTPRAAGSTFAKDNGFDAIAYLDADNWFAPEHIETMVALHQSTGAAICSASRYLTRTDGSIIGICLASNGKTFIDTNCYFFTKDALSLATRWTEIPSYAHAICDRVMFHYVRRSGISCAHADRPTVYYRVSLPSFYRRLGEPVPPNARGDDAALRAALDRWEAEGYPSLRFNLEATYDKGRGVAKDDPEMARRIHQAAEQGNATARFELATMYATGGGVPPDDAEAVKWFRKAAEQGHAFAQSNLGVMYANGRGVPQDYVEAYRWFDLAAAQISDLEAANRDKAVRNRARVAAKMTRAQIAEAQKLAREWEPRYY